MSLLQTVSSHPIWNDFLRAMEDFFRTQVNDRDAQRTSVLQHAIKNGDAETIGILLSWGAIADPRDVELAEQHGRKDGGMKADLLRAALAHRGALDAVAELGIADRRAR